MEIQSAGVQSAVLKQEEKEENQDLNFEQFLRGALEGKSEVNEEELYNMLVGQELGLSEFNDEYNRILEQNRRADGYSSVEDATNKAVESLVASGLISEEDADNAVSSSFQAAQLDDNLGALYDGRGSADDPTMAKAGAEEAILRALANLEGPQTTENSVDISTAATSQTVEASDGQNGFLWKPASERDGNLVVLLPTELKGQVESATILDKNGQILEKGVFSGDDHNGNRPHFRFTEPGSSYGTELVLRVMTNNGETLDYLIPNGAERLD